MKRKTITKNLLYLILFILIETILIKYLQYKILPAKYFYDSNSILSIMNGNKVADKSYMYVSNIFNIINIFKFTTIQQWSNAIAIIFTPIIIFSLLRNKSYKPLQSIFIIASVALLNIYVFNLSKDIIQFVYFLLIYFVLKSDWKNTTKILVICCILLYEALNFRIYYAIMAILVVTIYFIYNKFVKNRNINKKTIVKIVILSLIIFFLEVFCVQILSQNNYNTIMNARYSINIYRENSIDAATIIKEPLGQSTNFIKFIGNYIINGIRMMFPIELLDNGVKYIPFVVYQIYITIQILKCGKRINEDNILWIITIIAFIMVSIIFEPDFGSFIRHESSLILILLELTNINQTQKNKDNINILKEESIFKRSNKLNNG